MADKSLIGKTAKPFTMPIEWGKVREQFGRPIGSFQAIQHKCANMLVELESARSAVSIAISSRLRCARSQFS